nr:hypothetical protein [Treponema sp.]
MVNHIKKIAVLVSLAIGLVLVACSGLVNGSVSSDGETETGSIGVAVQGISSRAAMGPATLTVDS